MGVEESRIRQQTFPDLYWYIGVMDYSGKLKFIKAIHKTMHTGPLVSIIEYKNKLTTKIMIDDWNNHHKISQSQVIRFILKQLNINTKPFRG